MKSIGIQRALKGLLHSALLLTSNIRLTEEFLQFNLTECVYKNTLKFISFAKDVLKTIMDNYQTEINLKKKNPVSR